MTDKALKWLRVTKDQCDNMQDHWVGDEKTEALINSIIKRLVAADKMRDDVELAADHADPHVDLDYGWERKLREIVTAYDAARSAHTKGE